MGSTSDRLADLGALAFARIAAPALRFVAGRRRHMPRFQSYADRAGFQVRTTHYYEPTYRAADLPADTARERELPGLDLNAAGQLATLARFTFADELRAIPVAKPSDAAFGYDNPMYGYGDAELLYNMVRSYRPARIVEIGSGQSTLMARLAIARNRRDDPAYTCDHVCIEPYEAAWLEGAGVTVIRERVETVDLSLFAGLGDRDILFVDSSHVVRPWGDVLREFQQIIPGLAPGVFVHVHDIFTPRDYPEDWLRGERRLWNEQYLLESFLAFNTAFEVVCAANWLKHNHFAELAAACPMLGAHPDAEPGAFWFRRR